jgi:hypothetical protein
VAPIAAIATSARSETFVLDIISTLPLWLGSVRFGPRRSLAAPVIKTKLLFVKKYLGI